MWRSFVQLFSMLVLIFGLVACNDDNAARENQNHDLIKVKNSNMQNDEYQNMSNSKMAEHLAHVASSVPGVNSATAVVMGPYSVVGIDVNAELDRTRVGTIKYSVAEALKQDMHGNNTMVVADGDVTERIRRLSNKVKQGHPEDAIMDELAEIIGRYMPEVPQKENQPQEPDINKKMLDKQKEQQLENTEKEQSNRQM